MQGRGLPESFVGLIWLLEQVAIRLPLYDLLSWVRLLVAATVLASGARAEAMCAPQFWVGTPDGSSIPSSGSLYVFSNAYTLTGDYPDRSRVRAPLAINWFGTPGTIQQTEVSPNVIKVSYRGEPGSELHLGAGFGSARFKITDSWRAPATAPTVRKIEHDDSGGGCPAWNVLAFTLDQPTAAIRIRWTYEGATSEWFLPANDRLVRIGRRSCGGSTVPQHQLEVGGQLELTAIRVDGSEVAVRGVPSVISFNDAPKRARHDELEDALLPASALKSQTTGRPTDRGERILLSMLLLVANFGVTAWWLRRAIARLR